MLAASGSAPASSRGGLDPARQAGDGRRLEERPQRQLDAECRAHRATTSGSPAASGRRARRSRRGRRPARRRAPRPRSPRAASSVRVRGATGRRSRRTLAARAPAAPRRSTLPFGVSGSAASGTKADGTMYSGSARAGRRAARDAETAPAPSCGDDVGDQPLVAAAVARATTTASRDRRVVGAARPRSRRARSGSRGS